MGIPVSPKILVFSSAGPLDGSWYRAEVHRRGEHRGDSARISPCSAAACSASCSPTRGDPNYTTGIMMASVHGVSHRPLVTNVMLLLFVWNGRSRPHRTPNVSSLRDGTLSLQRRTRVVCEVKEKATTWSPCG